MSSTYWKALTGLLAVALLTFPRTEGSTADSWRPAPPDDREYAVLEDLSTLVSGNEHSSSYRLPDHLRRLISERSEGFELFRAYNGEDAHRAIVDQLPYGKSIRKAALRHGLDPLLLAALVEAESNFVSDVISPVGAIGLAQVMPSTAGDYDLSDLENPSTNLDLGARYLKAQLRRFDDNLELALAAYNAGPYAVERYDGVPPYRETRRYVDKVLSIYLDHHQSLWHQSTAAELLVQ
jgi:hypothetical protein